MSTALPQDGYAVLSDPTTLTIERILPGTVERVWAYLANGWPAATCRWKPARPSSWSGAMTN